ncbi:MAG: porin family protein [Bacteroidales bacterium]|nr:porin family protein [Bacteroidales bacterium]MBR2606586.1 porin family protein [Bacteroidaceae bacterium]
MKNFRILFAACLLAMATAVNAQFANSSSTSSFGGGAADTEGWQSVKFSYNRYTAEIDGPDCDAVSAFELGYSKAISLSQELPLFLEAGASFFYATGECYDEDYYKGSISMASLIVPFNLGYKVALSDNMSLFPYVGLSLKGHLFGEIEEENEYYDETYTINVFDDDDLEDPWNRFQIGWQIGATLNINKYNVGLSYGTDITELGEDMDTKTFKLSLGVNF